jgi:hypothetical protein
MLKLDSSRSERLEDETVWKYEESLWTGDAQHYRESIDPACLMVLPAKPFIMSGEEAVKAVADTPRWSEVTLSDRRLTRQEDSVIVVAYKAVAKRETGNPYEAHCTTTYRKVTGDQWRVIQHQQTPPLAAS